MNLTCTIYHTCHLEGTLNSIFAKSPYKCEPSPSQWLGDGYYFWTDSDYFAHKWGERKRKYPKGYVITEYLVDIPKDSLLDLVGNVKDQLIFKYQILEYVKKMSIELKDKEDARNIPVSKVLAHLRLSALNNTENFKYNAIKAVDYGSTHTLLYKFTEDSNDKELIPIPTRQQLFLNDLCFLKIKRLFCAKRMENKTYKNIPIHKKEEFEYKYKGD